MALTDPKNTLAYHNSRVFTSQRDMSDVPLHFVVGQLKTYLDSTKSWVRPEAEATIFYSLNHGMALIGARKAPLQPLDEWEERFARYYHHRTSVIAARAFYYLLVICNREARHNKSMVQNHKEMTTKFGAPCADFFRYSGAGEEGIHQHLLNKTPACSVGTFVDAIRWQFYNSEWSGGFGGAAWGAVTDCLCRFVKGEYSAEMMVDTVWTLSHNNGPIFNKPYLYVDQDDTDLLRVLDIQRSGQMVEGAMFDETVSDYVTFDGEYVKAIKSMVERYPGEFGAYVDWFKVSNLGGIGYYAHDQAKQEQNLSPEEKAALQALKLAAQAEAAKKAEAEQLAAKIAAEKFAKLNYEIMPGVYVAKVEMNRAKEG